MLFGLPGLGVFLHEYFQSCCWGSITIGSIQVYSILFWVLSQFNCLLVLSQLIAANVWLTLYVWSLIATCRAAIHDFMDSIVAPLVKP